MFFMGDEKKNDKDIREVLVNYLLAQNGDLRIYHEKAIGESICDIMAVSSCLTGYEIKSDLDSFTRLERQVNAYNRYFDRCYLVIGESHRKRASDKIPAHWGLICIQNRRTASAALSVRFIVVEMALGAYKTQTK